jgi:hypothetical protein
MITRRRTVLMLWHAFLFLGLGPVGFFPPCSFCLVVSFSPFLSVILLISFLDIRGFIGERTITR